MGIVRQESAERRDGRRSEPRQRDGPRLELVGRHDRGAAGRRDHGDAAVPSPALTRQVAGDLDEVVEGLHLDDAELACDGLPGRVRAGERSGVSQRVAPARV